ncbi:MAG TPA: biotin carboxylase N-terminal domain-containing protein [Acidimicrobiia bacterium]|nr:biotin carboxylase N-terminal domain-containing protein [Acidimicrobiia bacterium]
MDAPRISKLLVANRGEIARRVFRSAHELGIATVAVFSDADADAPHAGEADEAVRLPGTAAADTYLRADLLVDAALRTGADAVHPGYGFLAENAAFARACADAGLTFVGPPPEAIEAMGSKLAAKALMTEAGVPVLPGMALTETKAKALAAGAAEVGYPLLVKASFGGGGRGMRVVRTEAELAEAVAGARREAEAAFGDGTVFFERYVEAPRHVEIQVLADGLGGVIQLFERECSIQRRHQKIVEESPSVALDEATRQKMGEAAIAAARAVDYVGAGTVEFLYQDGDFRFLEMNTRLQVEHPVTEMITGLDLVRLQLLVAMGEPLPNEALNPSSRGHAIEARLYAEDPRTDFLPVTGTLHGFSFPDVDGLRVDSGVEGGSEVGVHYDPMLAKVVAWAPTRPEAISFLSRSLERAWIHGLVTNRDLLVRVLRHPEFVSGDFHTGFLDRHDPAELGRPLVDAAGEQAAAVAAALASQAGRRRDAPVLSTVPSGWRNVPSQPQQVSFAGSHGPLEVGYRFDRVGALQITGFESARVVEVTANRVGLELDGILGWYDVARVGDTVFVDGPQGPVRLAEVARFPAAEVAEAAGSLRAPMPGKVVRVAVAEGDEVTEGQELLVMEAMKMEHTLRAPHRGSVTALHAKEGDQVGADDVLVVVTEP